VCDVCCEERYTQLYLFSFKWELPDASQNKLLDNIKLSRTLRNVRSDGVCFHHVSGGSVSRKRSANPDLYR